LVQILAKDADGGPPARARRRTGGGKKGLSGAARINRSHHQRPFPVVTVSVI
jgi:hypothetical protein